MQYAAQGASRTLALRWGKGGGCGGASSQIKLEPFWTPSARSGLKPEVTGPSFLHRTSSARRPQHRHLCESGSSRGHWSWDLEEERSGREGMEDLARFLVSLGVSNSGKFTYWFWKVPHTHMWILS